MHIAFFPESSRGAEQRRKLIDQAGERAFTKDYMRFGKDYFDNPELGVGYGTYAYDGRYAEVAKKFIEHYQLKPGDGVLEIGCAKGYLLVEFQKLGMEVYGIDRSEYAVENAHPDLVGRVQTGDAAHLPLADKSVALVIGKEVLPHIPESDIRTVIRECMRVSTGGCFFEIQCGKTESELVAMRQWDDTHQIYKTPEQWDALFAEVGYTGDVHYKVLIPDFSSSH